MELVEPITVIQYKYHEGEFGKLLNGAFLNFTKDEENISIIAKDKPVTVLREPLLFFSPLVRSALDSLPCCAKPALSLPDCSSAALQHLMRILKYGAADFAGELNTSEIIVAAKCLQIDVTNFEYVKREVKGLDKNPKIEQTKLTILEGGESDSDLDENEVDDYGEEDDDLEVNMEIETTRARTKVNKEIDSQVHSLLDDSVNDGQDTLDENTMHRSVAPPSLPLLNPQNRSSQPPFKYNNLPQTRPDLLFHTQPQRAQTPLRYPAQYNHQQVSAPPTRPQSMGLWAQSAKPVQPNPTPYPGSVHVGPPPSRPMTNQEFPRAPPSTGSPSCQICQKTTPSVAMLCQHYARTHFTAELKSDYAFMAKIANKSCKECKSQFKSVDALFLHIGTVHRKVNEIMEKKGLVCLDMPIRSRKSM